MTGAARKRAHADPAPVVEEGSRGAGHLSRLVFFNPASSSVLPALVDEDELVAANTGIWTAAVLSQIVLAPLAGFLVVTVGYGPVFAVNAISYAISALILRGLHVRSPARVVRRRLLADAREGVGCYAR